MQTRKLLRAFFLIQTICLCLTLLAAGTTIVARRTEYMVTGVEASVQTDTPVQQTLTRLSDKLHLPAFREWFCCLPYPVGNIAAIINSIKKILSSSFL